MLYLTLKVLTHKTSLTLPLFIEASVPSQKGIIYFYMHVGLVGLALVYGVYCHFQQYFSYDRGGQFY